MKINSVNVSYHKNTGFRLYVVETSLVRNFILGIFDAIDYKHWLCRHSWFYSLNSKVYFWAEKNDTVLSVVPITREQANQISGTDAWSWLDEDSELTA